MTGPYLPEPATDWRAGLDAMRGHLTELRATLRDLAAGHYSGTDSDGICTVTVDGTGLVESVRFVDGVTALTAEAITALVLAGLAAANMARAEAMADRLTGVTERLHRTEGQLWVTDER